MNDGHGNGGNSSVNGKPYDYSADNGFACAAAGRGITEALQEHLNVIARDASLATEMSRTQIQADIEALVEDKERLEQQKLDRQESLMALTEELAGKDARISELNTELEAPLNEDMPQQLVDISNEIDEKTTELEGKKVERVELETDLENPTEIELNPPVGSETQPASKQRFTRPELIFVIVATLALLGLVLYICVFYGSAGEKAFTAVGAENQQELDEIIDSQAFLEALWESPNLLILTFPIIFIMLAIVIHPSLEKILNGEGKKGNWLFLMVAGGTVLVFDIVIALRISRNMFMARREAAGESLDRLRRTLSTEALQNNPQFEKAQEEFAKEWPLNSLDIPLDIFSVLLAGFAVAFLLGVGIYYVLKMWKGTQESDQFEKQIRVEKNDRLVQLNALTTEIQFLENRIGELKQEKEETFRQQLNARVATHKHPIEVEITRLTTEKENSHRQIDERNEQIESLQQEINQCETEIEALSNKASKQRIDMKKLEAHANEFVSGWCRYVAQRRTELSDDVSTQIRHIQHFANETLEGFKASLQ